MRRPRRNGVVAAVMVVGALAAGCTTARSDLATSDSTCYKAIPAATKAVRGQGHLLGVERSSLATLRRQAPVLLQEVSSGEPSSQVVCVIGFKGRFTSTSVAEPHGASSGQLAVVVTTTPGDHLLGTVVFRRPPPSFGRMHFG
jgi:hypothetical protein